jgi:hypothetical protein
MGELIPGLCRRLLRAVTLPLLLCLVHADEALCQQKPSFGSSTSYTNLAELEQPLSEAVLTSVQSSAQLTNHAELLSLSGSAVDCCCGDSAPTPSATATAATPTGTATPPAPGATPSPTPRTVGDPSTQTGALAIAAVLLLAALAVPFPRKPARNEVRNR